jgi:hypothetical protein
LYMVNIKQPAMFHRIVLGLCFSLGCSESSVFVRWKLRGWCWQNCDIVVPNDPYPEDKSSIHNVSVCPVNVFKKYLQLIWHDLSEV